MKTKMTQRKNKTPTASKTLMRTISVGAINEEERSVELAWASEKPYVRWFGPEILQCDEDSVRLSRLETMGVLLFNHDTNQVIGKALDVRVDKDFVCRATVQFDDDEESEKIFQKVKSGTLKGVSVGYRVHVWEDLVDSEAKSSCGRHTGPAMVAKDWEPFEISIVAVPADDDVGVGRSLKNEEDGIMKTRLERKIATQQAKLAQLKRQQAEEELKLKALREVDEDEEEKDDADEDGEKGGEEDEDEKDADEDEEKADDEEEEKSLKKTGKKGLSTSQMVEVVSLCRDHGVDSVDYLKKGMGPDQVRKAILEGLAAKGAPVHPDRVDFGASQEDKYRDATRDALMMRAGIRVEKPAAGAADLRGLSLIEAAREHERVVKGRQIANREDLVRSVFSASSTGFIHILANVAEKSLQEGYQIASTTFDLFTKKGSLRDYKPASRVSLGNFGILSPVPEGAEYERAQLADSGLMIQLAKYGKTFGITREAIINDDLSAFTEIPRKMGIASKYTLEHLVYHTLLNGKTVDGGAIFSTTNGNLVSPGTTISVASLGAAIAMMRRQVDDKTKETPYPIIIEPQNIIVPPELETIAKQLIASTVDPTGNNNVVNPYQNQFRVIPSAYLADKKAWYLAGNPNITDTIEVSYLDGNEAPTIEEFDHSKNDSREFKVRLEAGVTLLDHKGLLKNVGA